MDALWEVLSTTEVLGHALGEIIAKVLLVVVVTAVAALVQRIVLRAMHKALTRAQVPTASFISNMLKVVIWSLALITVLEPVFGVQPTAFVAALGVGSVALSLGLQDTMSNVIGGLALMMGKVIEPGDVIKVNDFTGVVTDINWRATCVSDQYGQVNIIPNSVLSKVALVKIPRYMSCCCLLPLLVLTPEADLDEVRADLTRIARERLGEWFDEEQGVQVLVKAFDAGKLQVQVAVHVVRGVLVDEATTRMAAGVVGQPWVKVP